MGNLWKVARAEYARLAHKRSFILSLIGMPIFIGAIMAIGVAMANAILLIKFAENTRRAGQSSTAAAIASRVVNRLVISPTLICRRWKSVRE